MCNFNLQILTDIVPASCLWQSSWDLHLKQLKQASQSWLDLLHHGSRQQQWRSPWPCRPFWQWNWQSWGKRAALWRRWRNYLVLGCRFATTITANPEAIARQNIAAAGCLGLLLRMMIGQLTLKNATQCLTNSSQQEAVFGKSPTMTWKIPKNLPRKRKDTKFDKLLQTLRLLEKRQYVSQLWLLFCKARDPASSCIQIWKC